MKNYLYIITNISMPNICKVGITSDVDKRLRDLNKTSTPTRFQVYETFDLKNVELLEQKILQHFAKQRINRKREFLEVHPERVCDFISDNKHTSFENESEVKSKFSKIGINEGDILKFKEGDEIYQNITAIVGKGNSIVFKDKKTSLSPAALRVLKEKFEKNWKSAQGSIFWTHKGKTIRELMDENNL